MHGCIGIITDWLAQGGHLTPLQRLEAMRRLEADEPLAWYWSVIPLAVGAALVVAACVWFVHRRLRRRAARSEFHRRSSKAGLSGKERKLLAHVVALSGVQIPATVLTDDRLFDAGATRLLDSGRLAAMPQGVSSEVEAMLASIRQKLGYPQVPVGEAAALTSSRQIPPGSVVSVIPRGHAEPIKAIVLTNEPGQFAVESSVPVKPRAGEQWTVRCSSGVAMWEFDAPVIGGDGSRRVVLGHSHHLRFVNLRRFARVATDRKAWIAPFPFSREQRGEAPPQFTEAKLVEIAGPGLQLRSSVEVKTGDRVLAIIAGDRDPLFQGMAKVRRVNAGAGAERGLVVEMVGLSSNEVAELARETHVSASRMAEAEPEAQQVPV